MNLYGWSLPAFKRVLGSKDSAVLEKASALISETLPKEPAQSNAKGVAKFPHRERISFPTGSGAVTGTYRWRALDGANGNGGSRFHGVLPGSRDRP